jgi:pimeloyl-ACP methyl ester carboxylesterase
MPTASEIYYFAHQADEPVEKRPPVILIHGAGGNLLSWPPQIRRMDGETIYVPDLPGHGKSEGVGRHSIDEYADDIISFMKEIKLRAAVMVGISMGGAIALTLAVKFPKKVLGLGLIGCGVRMPVAKEILETAGNPNSFESAVETINQNCFNANAPQSLLELSKKQMMETRPPVLLGDFLACNEFDISDRLNNINTPTLIICGVEDRMIPLKNSELLQKGIINSRLHMADKAGHMVMAEQPDIVAGLLKQFIDELPKEKIKRVSSKGKTDPVQQTESTEPNQPVQS